MPALIASLEGALAAFSQAKSSSRAGPSSSSSSRCVFGVMPAYMSAGHALGCKLVTVFHDNAAPGLPSQLGDHWSSRPTPERSKRFSTAGLVPSADSRRVAVYGPPAAIGSRRFHDSAIIGSESKRKSLEALAASAFQAFRLEPSERAAFPRRIMGPRNRIRRKRPFAALMSCAGYFASTPVFYAAW